MKKILYSLLFMVCLCSCAEDHIGQTPTDNIRPAVIQDVVIESMPGGAKISYALPKETDISYVKGEYLVNGTKYVVRSSVYKNYLMIEGLGSTEPLDISLYTVDHSENLSEPVIKKINPGTPLVDLIMQSMKITTDFGGIKVTWENVLASEVGITVLATNDKGEMEEGETLFTDLKNGDYSFRGYDDSKRTFALCLTDKWGNVSDTLKREITPYFEKLLDKSKHKRLTLPGDNTTNYSSSYVFQNLFDDKLNTNWITVLGSQKQLPLYFTIDLGTEAQLSRFKLWFRQSFEYKNQGIKEFEIWAASSYKENMFEDYWIGEDWRNDWEKLGDFVTDKPSGMDSPVTNSDIEYAKQGFEFNLPLDIKRARYIRVVMNSNWSGGSEIELAELSFYGNDK